MYYSKESIISMLESKTTFEPMTGCQLWIYGADKNGYGKLKVNDKHWRAHRLSYLIYKGHLEDSDLVCHKCDTPACINPDHLFLGTPLTNMQDKVKKGRLKNQNMSKTHCKRGHEFTLDNILYNKTPIGTPRRTCAVCYVDRYKIRNARAVIRRKLLKDAKAAA